MMPIAMDPVAAQRVAGALIHFIWQGAVIGLMAAAAVRALSGRKPEVRYAVAIAALSAMALMPIVTFSFYAETGALAATAIEWLNPAARSTATGLASPAETAAWTAWILLVWAAGVAVFLTRLLIGWGLARRLVRSALAVTEAEIRNAFEKVAQQMGLAHRARLMLHSRVDSPVAIGWLRPVVLAPVAWISGLNEAQLSAIFAHELAHIRRHDFLVNMLQRTVEAVLFYHPAVWWLSNRIRLEREHCCDDLAIRICGSRRIYAEALIQMERARQTPALAVAAADHAVLRRFRRILGLRDSDGDWQSVAAAALFVAALILIAVWPSTPIQALPVAWQPLSPPILASAPPSSTQPASSTANPLGVIAAILTGGLMGSQGVVAPQESPSIEGMVVQAGTREGLSGANVELTPISDATGAFGEPRQVVSGAEGRFSFPDLTVGTYRLVADLPQSDYHPGAYGQREPGSRGVLIRLGPAQKIQNARIEMTLTGAIAGRVTNARGEPVARARVAAMAMTYREGRPALKVLQLVQTDDLGRYRLFWLSPGTYYIGARTADITRKTTLVQMTAPGRTVAYEDVSAPVIRRRFTENGEFEETDRMVYYGNTLDPSQAARVNVSPGRTSEGVNLSLAVGVSRAFRVRGVVIGNAGNPRTQAVSLRLIPRTWTPTAVIPNATASAEGVFEIAGAVPGSYFLYASSGTLNGRMPIDVGNADVNGLRMVLGPGIDVMGRIAIDGDETISLSTMRVSLVRDPDLLGLPESAPAPGTRGGPGAVPGSIVSADGVFRLPRIGVGDYRLQIDGLPKGAFVVSAQMGQESVFTAGIHADGTSIDPIQIHLGTGTGRIEGWTANGIRESASNAMVVLVPEAAQRRQRSLFKKVASDSQGRFTIEEVPPGTYKLFAWDSIAEGIWENEMFLETVEGRGSSVTVTPKTTTKIDSLTTLRP